MKIFQRLCKFVRSSAEHGEHRPAGEISCLCELCRALFVQSCAEQYFSSSNFLNKKILEDISHVRDSYEDAWHGLEENEKEQVRKHGN